MGVVEGGARGGCVVVIKVAPCLPTFCQHFTVQLSENMVHLPSKTVHFVQMRYKGKLIFKTSKNS